MENALVVNVFVIMDLQVMIVLKRYVQIIAVEMEDVL